MTITYRTDDPTRWGTGKGSDLTATDFDLNIWLLFSLIEAINSHLTSSVGISGFSVTGNQMTVLMDDSTTRGPFTLPTGAWNFRGVWAALTVYAVNDVVSHGTSVYIVLVAHTSASTFDPGATDGLGHPLYGLLISVDGNLPTGGATDQVLVKESGADFDATWAYVTLAGLHDVSVTSPSPVDGDVLTYESGFWVAKLPTLESGGGGGGVTKLSQLTDVDVPVSPSPADDDILTWNSGDDQWVAGPMPRMNQLSRTSISSSPEHGDILWYDPSINSPSGGWANVRREPYSAFSTSGTATIYKAWSWTVVTAHGHTLTIPNTSGGQWSGSGGERLTYFTKTTQCDITFAAGSGVTLTVPHGRLAQSKSGPGYIVHAIADPFGVWYPIGDLVFDPAAADLDTNSYTIDLQSTGALPIFTTTPTADQTITCASQELGTEVTIVVYTSGSTSRTLTFGSGFVSQGTLATGTVTGKTFTVSFISDGTNLVEKCRTVAM